MCLFITMLVLQSQTYALQVSLQKNMCASYLIISADHAEVKQVVGETREITRLVATRSEDVTFAMNLGTVLIDHLKLFTEPDSMSVMGELCFAKGCCCCCHNTVQCHLVCSFAVCCSSCCNANKQQHFKG